MDKYVPTAPKINLKQNPSGTGNEPFGVLLYNKDISVNITPGEDYFLEGVNNIDKTTYEVTSNEGNTIIVPETELTEFEFTQEGIITIVARTYDKAGNIGVSTKVIWINKDKPTTPKITDINGTSVKDISTKEIISALNTITLQIDGLTQGNDVIITLINEQTYEKTEVVKTVDSNNPIQISLSKQGSYSIKVKQTNMFGTTSQESTGIYTYTYRAE